MNLSTRAWHIGVASAAALTLPFGIAYAQPTGGTEAPRDQRFSNQRFSPPTAET